MSIEPASDTDIKVDKIEEKTSSNGILIASKITLGGRGNYAVATGSSNAYAITLAPAIPSYVAGQVFHWVANHTCTGTSTLNVNAKGAKTIKHLTGATMRNTDIPNGSYVTCVYNGTDMIILSQQPCAQSSWGPSVGAASGSIAAQTAYHSRHEFLSPRTVRVEGTFTFQLTGGPAAYITVTLPVAAIDASAALPINSPCTIAHQGTAGLGYIQFVQGSNTARIYRADNSSWSDSLSGQDHNFSLNHKYHNAT